MQWTPHIKHITQRVIFKLGKTKSIGNYLTGDIKKLLINALVMPYFHYCSPAWSNATSFRLEQVNKRVVSAYNFRDSKQSHTIYKLFDRNISVLTFKALNKIAPKYVPDKISVSKNCHKCHTGRPSKNDL